MESPTVFLVDDHASIRQSFSFLLEANNMRVETFCSAVEFLEKYEPNRPGCLVLDIRMPEMSGLELQEQLNISGITLPVIIVSGHADVQLASTAFRAGAIDVLEKPVPNQELIKRIREGLGLDAQNRAHSQLDQTTKRRLETLTPKERSTLELMTEGSTIKQIAGHFNISIQTAAKHRARVLEKMKVDNEVKLIHLLGKLGELSEK